MHTAHTGAQVECPSRVTGEAVPLALQDTYYIHKATLPSTGDVDALIDRNKHRGAGKMQEQRTGSQMKKQQKSPEKKAK